jgi:hypothetical protein
LTVNKTISENFFNPWSLFVTDDGNIFVDNGYNNGRIDKLTLNDTIRELVMHVNSSCTGIFIDITNSLYCSSANEHRNFNIRLDSNTTTPIIVAGTQCPEPVSTMLDHPHGICVDDNLNLFVADSHNN